MNHYDQEQVKALIARLRAELAHADDGRRLYLSKLIPLWEQWLQRIQAEQ